MLLLTKYTVLYKENEICCIILLSLPSRERGLKFASIQSITPNEPVAPFAGAWIEIYKYEFGYMGRTSLPSRERGLKCRYNASGDDGLVVAPFAGAWIEILLVLTR